MSAYQTNIIIQIDSNCYIDNDRCIYFNLSKSIQIAAGLKFEGCCQWARLNMQIIAQLVERRPQDPMYSMTRGSNPVRSTRKFVTVFPSQYVVLSRRCAPPPRVYARIRTHAR